MVTEGCETNGDIVKNVDLQRFVFQLLFAKHLDSSEKNHFLKLVLSSENFDSSQTISSIDKFNILVIRQFH